MPIAFSALSSTERLRLSLCALSILLGATAIAGWLLEIEQLKSVVPGFSTMKFNTAVGFILSGIGLAATPYRRIYWQGLALLCGLALTVLGFATLFEYVAAVDLGIDQAIVRDVGVLTGSGHPGRMSVLTAFAWVALGSAILLLARGRTRSAIVLAHLLACFAASVSILAVAGYTFGAEAFWGIGFYTAIAVHTAVGLVLLAAAALITRAGHGWLEPFVDSPAARAMLVRLLPLALVLPVALGFLIMLGSGLGAYNAPYGLALFIPATSLGMVAAALWVARRQREAELVERRYERHLQLVVAELNHRVKNTLAIVQSLAHQSLKGAESTSDAHRALDGRLQALARAHNMLTKQSWDSVGMRQLVESAVYAHSNGPHRFQIDGPELEVAPKTSVTVAMTLHELATNSVKYGALSSPNGFVRIGWTIEDGRFRFLWREVDGPPCEPPSRRGFGSRMLERALAAELGGKAVLDYRPDGLSYSVEAPANAPL